MDFACSRCAHRQAEDTSCGGCGHDVVQDMRDLRGRQVLLDAEARLRNRRLGRYISVGAVLGMILAPLIYYAVHRIIGDPPPDSGLFPSGSYRWKMRIVGSIGFAVWAGCCLGVVALLERTRGRRRKFPYLDEYEKSSASTASILQPAERRTSAARVAAVFASIAKGVLRRLAKR